MSVLDWEVQIKWIRNVLNEAAWHHVPLIWMFRSTGVDTNLLLTKIFLDMGLKNLNNAYIMVYLIILCIYLTIYSLSLQHIKTCTQENQYVALHLTIVEMWW